jgi:hypothetical protein
LSGLEPYGGWPEFRSSKISTLEVLEQLHEWLGESLRVEIRHQDEAGSSSFYSRLAKVEPGPDASEYLLRFGDGHATVSVRMSELRALRITASTGRTGWLEFKAGRRLVLEIGLEDADEVWRRTDETAGPK